MITMYFDLIHSPHPQLLPGTSKSPLNILPSFFPVYKMFLIFFVIFAFSQLQFLRYNNTLLMSLFAVFFIGFKTFVILTKVISFPTVLRNFYKE